LFTCSIQFSKKFWVSLKLLSWNETVLSASVRKACSADSGELLCCLVDVLLLLLVHDLDISPSPS
jgi:hypothetical protein